MKISICEHCHLTIYKRAGQPWSSPAVGSTCPQRLPAAPYRYGSDQHEPAVDPHAIP